MAQHVLSLDGKEQTTAVKVQWRINGGNFERREILHMPDPTAWKPHCAQLYYSYLDKVPSIQLLLSVRIVLCSITIPACGAQRQTERLITHKVNDIALH